jgi:hypothetical protein
VRTGDVLDELALERRRDGAFAWSVFKDATQPDRFVECFFEESWLEHLRHHERVTSADREIQARVRGFHLGSAPPLVTHLLAADPSAGTGTPRPITDAGLE